MCEHEGVYPLVCAVCLRTVGVVNVAEFNAMVDREEVYICSYCMHRPERYVEFTLERFTPQKWADMTLMVVQVPTYLAMADFNHAVPVVKAADTRTLVELI